MKLLLLISYCTLLLSPYQLKEVVSNPITIKQGFEIQVLEGLNKHHSRYKGNSFYEANVSRKPVYQGVDTIVYKIKFITNANGKKMWDTRAEFLKLNGRFICKISEIKILKKSAGLFSEVDDTNLPIEQLEDTPFNRAGTKAVENEIQKFFDYLNRTSQK